MTLNRLSGLRKRGSPIAKPAISTTRKTSGANRATRPTMSVPTDGAASTLLASLMSLPLSSRLGAQRHHRHQPLLARLRPADLAGDAALAHRDDAVADRQHLRQLRRDGDDRDAARAPARTAGCAPRPWRRRRCRASARRRSAPSAAAPASGRARPSADCRRRDWRSSCSWLAMRMFSVLRNSSTIAPLGAPRR